MRVFLEGASNTVSLDAPLSLEGEGDYTLGDQLAGERPGPVLETLSLVEVLGPHLRALDAMAAGVLTLYFGLNREPPQTLEAIARVFGVSHHALGR